MKKLILVLTLEFLVFFICSIQACAELLPIPGSDFYAPMAGFTYSSRFGPRTLNVESASTWHAAIDLLAAIHADVHPIYEGTVVEVGYNGDSGKYVVVRHDSIHCGDGKVLYSSYQHLSDNSRVKENQKVTPSDVIGNKGSTGIGNGEHLDMRVFEYSTNYEKGKSIPWTLLDSKKLQSEEVDPGTGEIRTATSISGVKYYNPELILNGSITFKPKDSSDEQYYDYERILYYENAVYKGIAESKAHYVCSRPYAMSTNETSKRVIKHIGGEYGTSEFQIEYAVENAYGNVWYKVSVYDNGKYVTGYISSNNVKYVRPVTTTGPFNATWGLTNRSTIKVDPYKGYSLRGSLGLATGISHATATVKCLDTGEVLLNETEYVNGNSTKFMIGSNTTREADYDGDGRTLDNKLSFASLLNANGGKVRTNGGYFEFTLNIYGLYNRNASGKEKRELIYTYKSTFWIEGSQNKSPDWNSVPGTATNTSGASDSQYQGGEGNYTVSEDTSLYTRIANALKRIGEIAKGSTCSVTETVVVENKTYGKANYVDTSTGEEKTAWIEMNTDTVMPIVTTIPVTGISLNRSAVSLHATRLDGVSETIDAGGNATSCELVSTIQPGNATNKQLTWTTSNANVATVSNGIVTAQKPGTATITCASVTDPSVKVTCTVTVYNAAKVTSIRTTLKQNGVAKLYDSNGKKLNEVYTLTYYVEPSYAVNKEVTIYSTNPEVLEVSNVTSGTFKVKPISGGTANVVFQSKDGGKSIQRLITVDDNIQVKYIVVKNEPYFINLKYEKNGIALPEYSVYPSNATDPSVTISISDTTIAKLSADKKKIVPVKTGTTCLVIKANDKGQASATYPIEVISQPGVSEIELDPDDFTIHMNNSGYVKINTRAYDSDYNELRARYTWTSSDPTIATVKDGFVYCYKEGLVTFTCTASNGRSASADCECYVITDNSVQMQRIDIFANDGSGELWRDYLWGKGDDDWDRKKLVLAKGGNSFKLCCEVYPESASMTMVNWTSSNTNVITVDGDGTLHPVGTGTATVTAKARYGAGKDSVDVTVVNKSAGSLHIVNHFRMLLGKEYSISRSGAERNSFDEEYNSFEYGWFDENQLGCLIYPRNYTIPPLEWTSTNEHVATVDRNGYVVPISCGRTRITVTATDGSGLQDSVLIHVSDRGWPNSASLAIPNPVIEVGEVFVAVIKTNPAHFADEVIDEDYGDGAWFTTDPDSSPYGVFEFFTEKGKELDSEEWEQYIESTVVPINKYDDEGRQYYAQALRGLKPCKFKYKWLCESEVWPELYATGTVTVVASNAKPDATSIKLDKTSLELNCRTSESAKLTATVAPTGTVESLIWNSSDPDVASVYDGTVLANMPGTATITCALYGNPNLKATCSVKVVSKAAPDALYLSHDQILFYSNESDPVELMATFVPADAASPITWSSSDTSVATVKDGVVTPVANWGECTITATAGKLSASCNVTIKDDFGYYPSHVELDRRYADLNLYGPETLQLEPIIYPIDACFWQFTEWISSDPDVASVDEDGVVTAKGVGTAIITCIVDTNDELQASCEVTVNNVKTKQITLSTPTELELRSHYASRAQVYPALASHKLSVKSSNEDVLKVSVNDDVISFWTGENSGYAMVTITSADKEVSVDLDMLVGLKSSDIRFVEGVELNLTSYDLLPGADVTLIPTVFPTNATNPVVTWKSSDPSVVRVDNGVVEALSVGTATVTCSTRDGDYKAKCRIRVVPDAKLMISHDRAEMLVGCAFGDRIKLSCSIGDCKDIWPIQWSSDNESVATVNGEGIVSAVSGGNCTITGKFFEKKATCRVRVTEDPDVIAMPAALRSVSADAFSGNAAQVIVLGENVSEIGDNAFENCSNLRAVYMPATLRKISESAFANCSSFVVYSGADDFIERYCTDRGILHFITDHKYTRNTCIVSFDANGGVCDTASCVLNCGEAIGSLPTPYRDTYDFDGWYSSPYGGNRVTETTAYSIGTTVYAQWLKKTCKITYNANGGSCATTSTVINCGDAIGTLPMPTRTNYSFTGWYTSASGGTIVTENITYTENATLYAHWTRNTCVITFAANDGSGAAHTQTMNCGDTISELPEATRKDYTFAGWYTDPAGGEKVTAPVMFDRDTTLYASWTPNFGSGWVDPSAVPDNATILKTKTQYSYRDYSDWGGWSDWSTSATSQSDLVQVENARVWEYYWYQCPNCGAHWHVYAGIYPDCSKTWGPGGGCGGNVIQSSDWNKVWLPVDWYGSSVTANWQGIGRPCYDTGIYTRVFAYIAGGASSADQVGYRYRTRTLGAWSAWSDIVYSETNTRQVRTRTLVWFEVE